MVLGVRGHQETQDTVTCSHVENSNQLILLPNKKKQLSVVKLLVDQLVIVTGSIESMFKPKHTLSVVFEALGG